MSASAVRWCGASAILGGALWVAKAGAIIVTGEAPGYLFEFAPIFLSIGLVGLHRQLEGRGGKVALTGGALAYLGVVLSLAGAAVYAIDPSDTSDGSFSPLIFGSFLAIFASLILLGIAYRRTEADIIRWQSLPFALGVVAVPLTIIGGGVLAAISERLFELPILLVGVGWMLLGGVLATAHPRSQFADTSNEP